MTGKADFSEEEWELVREGPPTAGMVALMAESGGTFRESWALAKAYTDAQGLGRLTEAVTVLQQKASAGEVAAYRKFALDVAERVAEAHKEADKPVSEDERAAIEKIAASLYPSPSE